MKRNAIPFALALALFCAAGARAQDQATASAPATTPASDQGKPTKEQMKAKWESGVKADCAAEIADGGICAGKDFDSGLEKCLHQNRKKLSAGCMAAVHPRRRGHKGATSAKPGVEQQAPASAPAQAPATTPAQ